MSRPAVLVEFPVKPQHGDYPNDSRCCSIFRIMSSRMLKAPECRPLPERRPSLKSSGPPDHNSDSNTIGKHLQVFVRDNNVEQALRALKRKMQREGIFREMRRRRAYEKPSERRTREKAEAIRRMRKAARKQAQREGLIPMPKRRDDARRSVASPRSF